MKTLNLNHLKFCLPFVLLYLPSGVFAQSGPSSLTSDISFFSEDEFANASTKELGGSTITPENSDKELKQNLNLNDMLAKDQILFKYRDHELTNDAKIILDKMAIVIMANPTTIFEVSGHADARGWYDDNLLLSQRRAQSTVTYLVSKGVAQNQLKHIGIGEIRLKNICDSDSYCKESQHSINRRVEIKVLKVE